MNGVDDSDTDGGTGELEEGYDACGLGDEMGPIGVFGLDGEKGVLEGKAYTSAGESVDMLFVTKGDSI